MGNENTQNLQNEMTIESLNGYGFNARKLGGVPAEAYALRTDIPKMDMNAIYPVGSIYMSVNSTSPAQLFGGTWEQLIDYFLFAAGGGQLLGRSGGAWYHNHQYAIRFGGYHCATVIEGNGAAGAVIYDINTGNKTVAGLNTVASVSTNTNNNTASASKKVTMNNYETEGTTSKGSSFPPYLAVNMWKRVS